MKSILLIGMGRFGKILGEKLLAMGDEVMVVDKNEAIINQLASKYENAVITDCMNIENLAALDIPSFDAAVVAISDDFQSSLEITSLLKDLGAKYVISKASTEIQRKFLLKNGADEVIYPNHDLAEKIAIKLNSERVLDYIELDDKHSIFEISVPIEWIGKKIISINPRKKHGINILTIKNDKNIITNVDPNYVFSENEQVLIFGDTEKILYFINKLKK